MTVWSPRRQHRQHHDYPVNLWEQKREIIRREFEKMLGTYNSSILEVGIIPDDLESLFADVRDRNNASANAARATNQRDWLKDQVVLWRGCYCLRRRSTPNKRYLYSRSERSCLPGFASPISRPVIVLSRRDEAMGVLLSPSPTFNFAAFLRRP